MATITIEDVKKARSYMPIATKEAVVRLASKLCVRTPENKREDGIFALLPSRIEDRTRKLQFLHGVLAGWYFGGEFEKENLYYKDEANQTQKREINFCMSLEALDGWLEDHPMNQLERLKKEKSVANKVYDILYDFRAFEMLLTAAIREEMERANDVAVRMAQAMMTQVSPENLRETMQILTEFRDAEKEKGNA